MTTVGEIDATDVVASAQRVIELAAGASLTLRAFGGAAVAMTCPSAQRAPLARTYGDVDVIGRSRDRGALAKAFEAGGFVADGAFNALHSVDRLWFEDPTCGHKIEVFFDRVAMCHTLDLSDRLETPGLALAPADLLLLKLQVVQINEKDLKDGVALLADQEVGPTGIDPDRIATLLASDWGWWRTATANLTALGAWAEERQSEAADSAALGAVAGRITSLRAAIEAASKSRKWKMRARVGERKRWYELPDEVEL